MYDGKVRKLENGGGQWEILRPYLPERRHEPVDDGVTEQTADGTCLDLHGKAIGLGIAAADSDARNEVMQDEIVEDDHCRDDAALPTHQLENPSVCFGVVTDVVNGDIDAAWQPAGPAPDLGEIDAFAQCG